MKWSGLLKIASSPENDMGSLNKGRARPPHTHTIEWFGLWKVTKYCLSSLHAVLCAADRPKCLTIRQWAATNLNGKVLSEIALYCGLFVLCDKAFLEMALNKSKNH